MRRGVAHSLGPILLFVTPLIGFLGCGGEEFESGDANAGTAGTGATTVGGSGGAPGGGGAAGDGTGTCSSGQVCVPQPPQGWSSLSSLYVGVDEPGECPTGTVAELRGGVGVLTAGFSCSPCGCGAPGNVACSNPVVELYDNSNCNGSPFQTSTLGAGCNQVPLAYGARITVASAPLGGSCAANGGIAYKSDPAWESQARVCEGLQTGEPCEGGICAVPPDAPAGQGVCVYQSGVHDCPEGLPEQTIAYLEVEDTRACTTCSCGAPAGASCATTASAWGPTTCNSGTPTVLSAAGACADAFTQSVAFNPLASGGSCASSGGEHTGSAMPAAPVTVCCTL